VLRKLERERSGRAAELDLRQLANIVEEKVLMDVTDDLAAEVARVQWYHTMDLGPGVVSNGVDNTPVRLSRLAFPADLTGCTVLDVGAWDGFFSFEAERRGAERVLATDFFSWRGGGWGTKDGFNLARRVLGSKVEDMEIDVPDICAETVGTFDVVLFLGVLYHLRDPLQSLMRLGAVTHQLMIVETAVDLMNLREPAMAYYPGAELNGDPTNWWGPNPACVQSMLKTAGIREVRCVYRHSMLRRAAFAAQSRILDKGGFVQTFRQGRASFHALK
jgi:tRNA (mo5U34)-methyltransferase